MLIGLCGGSGSGKSTLIELLKAKFPGQISVIDMDNYYISRDELPFEKRRLINYDIPESLDWEELLAHINLLKDGKAVLQPRFSFQTYERQKETDLTQPAEILIVDGIFSLYKEELRKLYDLSVFVDVPSDIRLARRMLRNMNRYGRTAQFEISQYFEKVKPMHELYVEPCKKRADYRLDFERQDSEEMAAFYNKIRQQLKKNETKKAIK